MDSLYNNAITQGSENKDNKYHRINSVLRLIIFICCPIITVPIILNGLLNGKRWAIYYLGALMGMIGMLYPPVGDFYRYYEDYKLYKDLDWSSFSFLMSLNFDFLLSFLSYSMGKLNIPFDFSRFIYNGVAYLLYGFIYLDIIKSNKIYNNKKYRLFLLGSLIPFSISSYLFRFSFSTILFIYGAYQIEYKQKKIGFFFVILSILNHFFYLFLSIVFIISRFNLVSLSKKILIGLLISSFFISSDILTSLFYFLPVDIIERYSSYIDGYWASDYLQDHSWKFKLQNYINRVLTYIIIIIYIINQTKHSKMEYTTNGFIILMVIVSPFVTIANRVSSIVSLKSKVTFCSECNQNKLQRKSLKTLFYIVMISNIMGIWNNRRQIGVSDLNIIFFESTPTIISHTYDQKWISHHVFEDGNFK